MKIRTLHSASLVFVASAFMAGCASDDSDPTPHPHSHNHFHEGTPHYEATQSHTHTERHYSEEGASSSPSVSPNVDVNVGGDTVDGAEGLLP